VHKSFVKQLISFSFPKSWYTHVVCVN
uniref:Uncharacterized protein n=1 Tax=Amphimedon queenslandica TaxID=400682 RepID=A0A1X7SH20_AMPQE